MGGSNGAEGHCNARTTTQERGPGHLEDLRFWENQMKALRTCDMKINQIQDVTVIPST